jgi:hypothetical protein
LSSEVEAVVEKELEIRRWVDEQDRQLAVMEAEGEAVLDESIAGESPGLVDPPRT